MSKITPKLTENEKKTIFKSLSIYHFINDGMILLFPVLMVTYFEEFNLNWYQSGLAFSLNTLMIVVFQIINGFLVDKGYTKKIFIVGICGVTISSYLLHFISNYDMLLIISIISGLFFGFAHSINYSTTIKLFPKIKDSNEKLAKQGFAGDFGKLCAIFLSGILLIFFGISVPILVWNIISTVAAIYVLITITPINLKNLIDDDEILVDNNELINENLKISKPKINLKLIKTLLPFFAIMFLFNAYFDVIAKNIPTYLSQTNTGIISDFSELLFGIFMVGGVIGVYNAGNMRNKFGLKRHLIIVYLVLIVTLLVFVLSNPKSIIVIIILFTTNFFFMLSVYTNIFSQITHRITFDRVGTSMGLLLGLGWMGGVVGNWVGGFVARNNNPENLIWFGITMLVITLIIIISVKKSNYID